MLKIFQWINMIYEDSIELISCGMYTDLKSMYQIMVRVLAIILTPIVFFFGTVFAVFLFLFFPLFWVENKLKKIFNNVKFSKIFCKGEINE